MLEAFAAGVNALLGERASAAASSSGSSGARPEPWQPWDSMAVFKVRHIHMGIVEGQGCGAPSCSAIWARRAAALSRHPRPIRS